MDELLKKMQALHTERDYEDAHVIADNLLIEALKDLGKDSPHRKTVGQLIKAWDAVRKHYA